MDNRLIKTHSKCQSIDRNKMLDLGDRDDGLVSVTVAKQLDCFAKHPTSQTPHARDLQSQSCLSCLSIIILEISNMLLSALIACLLMQYSSGFGSTLREPRRRQCHLSSSTSVASSPLDDFLGNIFGGNDNNNSDKKDKEESSGSKEANDKISYNDDINNTEDDDNMSLSSFQQELTKRQEDSIIDNKNNKDDEDDDEFSGYDLRDVIYSKYGECFDVEFQRVDSYGFRTVYLVSAHNIT